MIRPALTRTLIGAVVALSAIALSTRCFAQQEVDTWRCLPEEVVGALRVPDGQAVFEALKRTKFGRVMFSEQRKAALQEVFEKHSENERWQEFKEVMAEYDLSTEDLIGLLAGESGYAVALQQENDEKPVFLGIGWVQPGEELAGKCYEAIGKAIENQDSEEPVTRVDLTLADQKVMQLQFPATITDYTEDFEMPEGYLEMTPEERSEAYQNAYEKFQNSAEVNEGHHTVLLCQLGDRLLAAHQFGPSVEDEAEAADELLSSLLAKVLSAHAAGGVEGLVTRLADNPSVERTFAADGLPVAELLVDMPTIIDVIRSTVDDSEESDSVQRVFRLFALDQIGPLAFRQTVESSVWRMNAAVSVPAPRRGLLQLLDQEMLDIEPPQWVPASVVRCIQFSFDLGKTYDIVKAEVTREFPEQSTPGFEMAEMQVKNFAQVELSELLSSLGNRHIFLSYGVGASGEESVEEGEFEEVTDRGALVWQVTDEQLWSKLLKVVAPFVGMAPGTEAAEEQGFTGYRMKSEQMEGGLFLGKGYLVLGFGEGVVETTLSTLNNPPSGSNALRGSETYEQASSLIDMQPAVIAEITDNDRYLSGMFDQLNQQFDQMEAMMEAMSDDEEDDDEGVLMVDIMRALMPKGDELRDLLGVTVSRTEIDDEGLFLESVQETPLAE